MLGAIEKQNEEEDVRSNSFLKLRLGTWEVHVPLNKCFLGIVLGIVFLFLFAWVMIEIHTKDPGSLTQHVIYALFNVNSQSKEVEAIDTKGSIYEFWTPSVDTPQSFSPRKAWESMDNEKRRWYVLDDGEETLRKFGESLMDVGATGYSYVEASGQGTSSFKKGLVWEVTFPQDSNMSPTVFIRLYCRFFHRDKDIFLKISGADATRVSRKATGEIILTHKALNPEK